MVQNYRLSSQMMKTIEKNKQYLQRLLDCLKTEISVSKILSIFTIGDSPGEFNQNTTQNNTQINRVFEQLRRRCKYSLFFR